MYPTREQAQVLVNCTQKCRQCINDAFCDKWSTLDIGNYFLAFHDALDDKQAELDKAHDYINRVSAKLKWWSGIVSWAHKYIAEADAMTKGEAG